MNDETVSFKSLIHEEFIHLDMHASNIDEVFDKFGEILQEKGYVCDTYQDELKKREYQYPTGLQTKYGNVAIPHTDAKFVNKPYIAIIRLQEPVLFKRMDDPSQTLNVKIVINLGFNKNESHMQFLQKIMQILNHKESAKILYEASNPIDICKILESNT